MNNDELYMRRCLQLARCGEMGAAPNPMVGAVIVHDDTIIGEGYHIRCGGPHAEVNAFASVRDESLLPQSTIYVSLEPCAHYGKTPPCAELIIKKKVKRVVVGCIDPFAKVQGKGIEMIRQAGIEVTVGVLEKECRHLNRRFFTFHTQQRPYITLKWAQSADGMMGIINTQGPSQQLHLSSPQALRRMHHLRATHTAIMVGYNTALLDTPTLPTRLWNGNNPVRVVFDPHGQLPANLNIFNSEAPCMVFGYDANEALAWRPHITQCILDSHQDPIPQLMAQLHQHNIQSLLVEGGSATRQTFIAHNLWDEMHVEHTTSQILPQITPGQHPVMAPSLALTAQSTEKLGTSLVMHYYKG